MTKIVTNLFIKIIVTENSPNDWSKMIITPLYKKCDKLNTANYRDIALLPITYTIFCKILMNRCSHIIESSMSDSQFGFRPGRGTTDAIFIIRQLIEKQNSTKYRSISTLLILKQHLILFGERHFGRCC